MVGKSAMDMGGKRAGNNRKIVRENGREVGLGMVRNTIVNASWAFGAFISFEVNDIQLVLLPNTYYSSTIVTTARLI